MLLNGFEQLGPSPAARAAAFLRVIRRLVTVVRRKDDDRLIKDAGLNPDARARDLDEEQLNKISEAIIEEGILVEGDLRREVSGNLKRLQANTVQCPYPQGTPQDGGHTEEIT